MRILHFADLHLGVERYGRADAVTGLSSRVGDFLRSLDRIVDAAVELRVDAVLFAGDAYKNRDPSPTYQREFALRLRRLVEAGIPTVLLVGNHDLPNAWGRATSIEIFQALAVPGLWVLDEIEALRLETASGPLQVVGLPWITRSHVLTDDPTRALSMDEARQKIVALVQQQVEAVAATLEAAEPAVLLAHGTLLGATYGQERNSLLGDDLVYTRSDLSVTRFDYVAMGHIHKHQAVGSEPAAVYPGSPERVDFGEEAEEKGYVLVEIGPNASGRRPVVWEFRPLPARPFRTLRLRAHGAEPEAQLLRAIERANGLEGSVTRVIVDVAAEAEGQFRPLELRKALARKGVDFVAGIQLQSEEQAARARLPMEAAETLSPLEVLGRYLAARQVPPTRATRLTELARTLLAPDTADTPG